MWRSIVLIAVLMFMVSGFAQTPAVDQDKWDVQIRSNLALLYGDGDYEVFNAPFAVGVDYKGVADLTFGLYLAPVIVNQDSQNLSTLSIFFHFTMLNKIGIGGGSKFWQGFEKGGFVKPTKENLFLTLNYDI